jgi:hypothetical protein
LSQPSSCCTAASGFLRIPLPVAHTRETEPNEIIYFKLYKSQIPVVEQALETAALMLGTDKSRGYCLEMICADFLAGAHLDDGNPEILLQSIQQFFKFLPGEQQHAFLEQQNGRAS